MKTTCRSLIAVCDTSSEGLPSWFISRSPRSFLSEGGWLPARAQAVRGWPCCLVWVTLWGPLCEPGCCYCQADYPEESWEPCWPPNTHLQKAGWTQISETNHAVWKTGLSSLRCDTAQTYKKRALCSHQNPGTSCSAGILAMSPSLVTSVTPR